METLIQTKVCSCCGIEKPISEFKRHGNSADGYRSKCIACEPKQPVMRGAKSKIEPVYHDELAKFMPRTLMEHLSALGYKGTLQIPHNITL